MCTVFLHESTRSNFADFVIFVIFAKPWVRGNPELETQKHFVFVPGLRLRVGFTPIQIQPLRKNRIRVRLSRKKTDPDPTSEIKPDPILVKQPWSGFGSVRISILKKSFDIKVNTFNTLMLYYIFFSISIKKEVLIYSVIEFWFTERIRISWTPDPDMFKTGSGSVHNRIRTLPTNPDRQPWWKNNKYLNNLFNIVSFSCFCVFFNTFA